MSHRLTSAEVDAAIRSRHFTVLPDGHTTVCSLCLDNGCWVHGMSHSEVPLSEHAEAGQASAFAIARREVWQLLQFRLADRAGAG
jgi:hypothetical protein